MSNTPEEFFVKGLMEQSPPSPSVFLDLPSMPDGRREEQLSPGPDDMVFPHISRMLMEDDIDDGLSDHPSLVQVVKPFAQILSSPSFGASTISRGNTATERTNDLLQDGNGDESTLSPAFFKDLDAVGAFLKGVEEANMFLPKDNGFSRVELASQMFRESRNPSSLITKRNRDMHLKEEEENRTSKVVIMTGPEEIGASDMLDEMMMRGYETCIMGMEKLRIAMTNEAEKNRKSGGRKTASGVVDLRTMLIQCAQAVSANDRLSADELLKQINKHASATGDATQRLAHCFAKGLEARLAGTGNQLCRLLMAERPSVVEFLQAYNVYMAACCFIKVAIMFSNMTIMRAMVGKSKLHIVDCGMDYSFHWAGLLRLLASREGGPPVVRITAIASALRRLSPAEWIKETGCQLSKCASEFGLPSFKFHTITAKWEDICIKDLKTNTDEVLVVNDLLNLSTLMDESVCFDDPSPRDTALNNIRKMRPDVFVQSIVNCSHSTSFSSRFRSALFYYTALFDMLDATIPRECKPRMVLEQRLMGRSALNVIACEGLDLLERPEKYRQWQVRNQRADLRQLPLKPDIVRALKDKVKKHHRDFLLSEDGEWLLQGWMGRILFAHSTWEAEDVSSD